MAATGITGLIKKRYSCRSYRNEPLAEDDKSAVEKLLAQKIAGPFGSTPQFVLLSSEPGDSGSLKKLGTYGFIKNPAAFVAGYVRESEMDLEDYGYCMEKIILTLTGMGLGSCWIGGSFRKSSFTERAGITNDEIIPAVASTGYIADKETITDRIVKAGAGSKKRKPWDELFSNEKFKPLHLSVNDPYTEALEMVRLAPSASNRQPWRVVNNTGTNIFHFYMERTASYTISNKLFKLADLQRIDMGISMCHFELTASENGLRGKWIKKETEINAPAGWEYTVTWIGE